jgi:hypothetical protein
MSGGDALMTTRGGPVCALLAGHHAKRTEP